MKRYIIVGGGVAGVTAAREVKKLDPESIVDIYSNEGYPYYYRPRLWEYIAGRITPEETLYHPAEWYHEQGIGLHLGVSATGLDREKHLVILSDGTDQAYDRLLIASGSSSFIPPVKGIEQPGVFALRSMDDAKEIVAFAEHASTAVLIGGGLQGLETAKALTDRGLTVTVIEYLPRLLPRQLDAEGAVVLEAHLLKQGLKLLTGQSLIEIVKNDNILQLHLQSGMIIETDMVVFSAGIRSNCAVWQAGGIETGRGVKVDEHLKTNDPDIFAAGDVAEFEGLVYGIIPAATEQGVVAAANMVTDGSGDYHGTLPSTKLKVAGMAFSCFGESTAEGEGITVLRRIEPEAGQYLRLALKNGILIGAIVLGDSKKAFAIKKAIASGKDVSAWQDQLLLDSFDFSLLA